MSSWLRRNVVCALSALALTALAIPSGTSAAAVTAVTGVKAISTSTSAIGIAWTAAPGVPQYRVQYSTSSTMSGAAYETVAAPAAELTGLAKGKTYYLKVRGLSADSQEVTAYSSALKVATRSSGYSQLSPTGLAVTAATKTSLALSWDTRGTGIRYRVSWATSSSFSGATYQRVTETSTTLEGLAPGKKYYVKVRVITESGSNLSAYSPAVAAATDSGLLPAPTGLAVTAVSKTAAALSWTASEGAEAYRVQLSRSSSMSSSRYVSISGPSAEITGLATGITYYFKVRVITPSGGVLSPYSAAVSVKTPTSSTVTYLPPKGLSGKASKPSKLTVSWSPRASGLHYQVRSATSPSMTSAAAVTVAATSTTIGGLEPATDYSLQVRVVSSTGSALSAYSDVASATTSTAVPAVLRVGSYNVRCANCASGDLPLELPWLERRGAVAASIKAQKLDVVGVQEASQGWLKDADGNTVNKSQFEDLALQLGDPYKLTNSHRNNCVKSTTPTDCVYKDQGASQGTRILYNSDKLELISQGSKRLSEIKAADNDRYVAWAVLEHKASGQRFFFASTHLENTGNTSGTNYSDLRMKQTQEILAVFKDKGNGLPGYVVGDFNSHKWTLPSNGPYDVMRGAGWVDPIGNTYRSTKTTSGATVQNRIRTNFSSFNGFKAVAPSFSYINGTYLDYIWTTPGIEVPEWETVVNVDADNNFVGIIPSDHNLIRATTVLP